MPFAEASRKRTFALVGITGHSGTGKTYSALRLATGMAAGGKVGLIDTENGRGEMYSDEFKYLVSPLHPPFTPERYTEQVKEAFAAGMSVLIIDSFSHEWEGTGGVLEMAEDGKTKNGKKLEGMAKWTGPKAKHKRLLNEILQVPMHVIICMRGKDEMIETTVNGKKEYVKTGVVLPIQDNRVDYEMTVSLILGDPQYRSRMGKNCPDKVRPLFDGQVPSESAGKALIDWLSEGKVINHDAERVIAIAREQAAYGKAMFTEHWKRLSPAEKAILKPVMAEMQAAALAADEAINGETHDAPSGEREPGEDG